MTLRPYIRGAAALLVVVSAASALALGDRAAATNTPMATAAAAKRLHERVVEGLADPLALEPEVFPVRGGAPDYGDADAGFGASRSGHVHEGQDVFAPAGTPLVALRAGVVVETGDDGGRGNYVAVFSPPFDETYMYLHMVRPAVVRRGDVVEAGDRVGRVGCTGSCWGDHLHLELRHGRGTLGRPRDPLPLLRSLDAG
jgi:murein DD-endopeptidase MepM/ murein hydrolase activator NlpD